MRRRSTIGAGLAAAVLTVTGGFLALGTTPAGAAVGGSGPYPADYETSAGLPNHTIFRPQNLPAERMPILVWGNGGCSANGLSQQNRTMGTPMTNDPVKLFKLVIVERHRCWLRRSRRWDRLRGRH